MNTEPIRVVTKQRYWVNWLLGSDSTDGHPQPFGTDTCEIVDEQAGGVIAYVHRNHVSDVLVALRKAEQPTCKNCGHPVKLVAKVLGDNDVYVHTNPDRNPMEPELCLNSPMGEQDYAQP